VLLLGDKTDHKYRCKCSRCSVQCRQLTELHFSVNHLLFFSYYYDYIYQLFFSYSYNYSLLVHIFQLLFDFSYSYY